jgi:hypothetical protein
MRLLAAVALALSLLAAAAAQKKKAPDVRIMETKALRDGPRITVDGKVKVTADKQLRGLVIVFDFRSPEKEVLTSQKTVIDEGALEAGREGAYHAEMADEVRAVNYTIRAFDSHEKELNVANPGPYVIE